MGAIVIHSRDVDDLPSRPVSSLPVCLLVNDPAQQDLKAAQKKTGCQ